MSEDCGFILMHRKLLTWEWYDDANTMRLFLHGILRANHAPKNWRGITIDRGQFISSYEKLAQELKLTKKQIRIAQTKLEETGEWAHEGHAQHTVFTVKNYCLYQDKGTPTELPTELRGAHEGHTRGTRGAPNNNDNNDNNKIIITPSPKRTVKTKIDPDLKFSEHWRKLALDYWHSKNRFDLNPEDQFFKFKNHHTANGSKFADWQASWTTWYCNAVEYTRPPMQVVHAATQQAAPRPIKTMRPAGSEQ